MTEAAKFEIRGVDASYWCVSGPGKGRQGVHLSPEAQGLIDAPVKTNWITGPYGQNYRGKRFARRELVLHFGVFGRGGESWHTVDSRFRQAFDYDQESTILCTTSDGVRELKVRLLEEPKAYGRKDPHLLADDVVTLTLAAELPFWTMPPEVQTFETDAPSILKTFRVHNDGDIPRFPRWTLTGGALYTLPDFSWGNDMYSRGEEDGGRTVDLPELEEDEDCVVDSDPRVQTIIAANESPVQNRWAGNDLLYPIMPGKQGDIPLFIRNATAGAKVKLTVPRWYSRPWSRPYVIA